MERITFIIMIAIFSFSLPTYSKEIKREKTLIVAFNDGTEKEFTVTTETTQSFQNGCVNDDVIKYLIFVNENTGEVIKIDRANIKYFIVKSKNKIVKAEKEINGSS